MLGIILKEDIRAWLTKDLRYDSNDSREIEKGSFSFNMLR